MSFPRRAGLLVFPVFLSLAASAQQLPPFGEAFPLANTRYVPVTEFVSEFFSPDAPLLRTNGRDAFVFSWGADGVRVTRAGEAPRIGRVVFPFAVLDRWLVDAVWTGTHFLVVAVDRQDSYRISGRVVSAAGEPVGDAFPIANGIFPAIAFDGRHVLLLYSSGFVNYAALLDAGGAPAAEPREVPGDLTTEPFVVAASSSGFAAVVPADRTGDNRLVLFDENGRIVSARSFESSPMQWTIASDGERYLVAGALADRSAVWLFAADGTLLESRELVTDGDAFYRGPRAIWSGDRWVVSRVADREGEVLELSADAKQILSAVRAGNTQVALGVQRGTVIGAWWANRQIVVGTYPFDSGWTPVAHKAADQQLLATATGMHGTLFVWNEEDGLLHAGFRFRDCGWRESAIANAAYSAVAASDGVGFVVAAGNALYRLNASGERLTLPPLPVPFDVSAIAWNGESYAAAGLSGDGRVVAALLTSSPTLTPVPLTPAGEIAGPPLLRARDGGFFAAWNVAADCHEFCELDRTNAAILDAELAVIGAPFVTGRAEEGITGAFDVAWNGSAWVMAYATGDALLAREIDPLGGLREPRIVFGESGYAIRVVPFGGDVAIGWLDPTALFYRAAVSRSGTIVHQEARQSDWGGTLLKLADERLAFAFFSPREREPHHNSMHLMLSIADAAPAAVPDAPVATLDGNVLSWTKPAGDVTGYRVEQRTGDDAWIELDRWLFPDQRSITLDAKPGPSISYRVRAFSDAGAGAYSQPVRGASGRRRSVGSGGQAGVPVPRTKLTGAA